MTLYYSIVWYVMVFWDCWIMILFYWNIKSEITDSYYAYIYIYKSLYILGYYMRYYMKNYMRNYMRYIGFDTKDLLF